MFCTSCGTDIGVRFPRFCPQCGIPLQADDTLTPTGPAPVTAIPDDDLIVQAHEVAETPQEPLDATAVPDNSPTILPFAPSPIGSPPNPEVTPPSQPSTSASAAPTFSGKNAKHRKKKHKKARGRAKLFAQNTPIEPFIGASSLQNAFIAPGTPPPTEPFIASSTPQNEPLSPFVTEFSPPIFQENNDRIVAEPLYPESSPVPPQLIRESTPPAMFGLAAIILIVFLGGLWWWNTGERDSFPENIDEPLSALPSESLPDAESSLPLSTLASPAEDMPAFNLEEQVSEQGPEPGMMSIPSLPTNQQQGRHNRYSPAEIKDEEPPLSLSPYPLPMPAPTQAIAVPPEPAE